MTSVRTVISRWRRRHQAAPAVEPVLGYSAMLNAAAQGREPYQPHHRPQPYSRPYRRTLEQVRADAAARAARTTS